METFGKITAWVLLLIASLIIRGIAISYSWNWIMVKIFNFQFISIPQAIALSFLISLIQGKTINTKKMDEEKESPYKSFFISIGYNLFGFGFCYIASLFL